MRETPTYAFRVADGPTPSTLRVQGHFHRGAGTFPYDIVIAGGTDPADVTAQLDAYVALADAFPDFLQNYLDDLAPCYGETGGQILDRWGYALGVNSWFLEIELLMADGQRRTVYQGASDYNNWPSVEVMHAGIEALIGAFPASGPPAGMPWVPEDENDFGGALTPRDLLVKALLDKLETMTDPDGVAYTTVVGPPSYGASHHNQVLANDPDIVSHFSFTALTP